jgi:hypothetical protein
MMPIDSTRASAGIPRRVAVLLAVLCLCSFAVKLMIYRLTPNLGYPDETFQYLEQAHRLVYGTGLVPWEFVTGIRSWLLPGLIAPGMAITRLLGAGPETFLTINAALCAGLSLSAVVCGGLWGWRAAGFAGAVIAGTLNAFWFESVYYAGHALSEAIAADFLVAALYLGYPSLPAQTPRRLFWAGLCFGAVLDFRLQLGPAVVVALLAICRLRPRAYLAAGLGLLGPLLLLGLVDWISWGRPFQSALLYVWANYSANVATRFGTSPWWQYAAWQAAYWSGAFVLIVPLALLGARRLPLLLLVALAVLGAHTLIPHKEPRFIFPAIPLLITLVGIGSAEILPRLLGPSARPGLIAASGVVFWTVTSGLLGAFGYFSPIWRSGEGVAAAMRNVDSHEASCGLAVYPSHLWWLSGGYTRLRPGIALYGLDPGEPDAKAHAAAYTDIITISEEPLPPPADFTEMGFDKETCWVSGSNRGPVCLWRRPGACSPQAAPPLIGEVPSGLKGVVEQLKHSAGKIGETR